MANIKFGRGFRILIQENNTENEAEMNFIEIKDPFTIRFDVNRDVNSPLNKFTCSIHNLALGTRSKIFQDRMARIYKRVIFQAGYGGELATLFQGNIFSAYSSREGTEIVTKLNCQDGGHGTHQGVLSGTFAKGTSKKDLIKNAIESMPTLIAGWLGDEGENSDAPKQRATTFDGNAYDFIKSQYNGVFIDNENVNILKDNEVTGDPILKFTSSTGLKGTPERQDSYVDIEVLFEPYVQVGQLIEIESSISPEFNGQYKVVGVKHSGVISKTAGGDVSTSLSLMAPNAIGSWKEVGK